MKKIFYIVSSLVSVSIFGILYFLSKGDIYFTRDVTMLGTLVLAIVTMLSFAFTSQSINHENPNKFVRAVMGGTMIKFFLCVLSVAALLLALKSKLHKPDLFLLMFVYMIYTVTESVFLSKLAREIKQS